MWNSDSNNSYKVNIMFVILAKEHPNSVLFMPAGITYNSREIAEIVAKAMAEVYWETQVYELTLTSYCNRNLVLR